LKIYHPTVNAQNAVRLDLHFVKHALDLREFLQISILSDGTAIGCHRMSNSKVFARECWDTTRWSRCALLCYLTFNVRIGCSALLGSFAAWIQPVIGDLALSDSDGRGSSHVGIAAS
jgi:hypothetical protein